MSGPVPLCDVKLMEKGRFPAQCHRDLGHDGLHRAFVVGGMGPGYWRDGDTETRCASDLAQVIDDQALGTAPQDEWYRDAHGIDPGAALREEDAPS